MIWTQLARAEATGLRRRLGAAVRSNPIIGLLAVVGAGAIVAGGWSAGAELAALAELGVAADLLGIVAAAMSMFGIALGALLWTQVPTVEQHDEQLRAAPIPAVEAYGGLTAVPGLAALTLVALATVPFAASLFQGIGVESVVAWSALFGLAQLDALLVGAILVEIARPRAPWTRRLAAALLAIPCLVLPAVVVSDQAGVAWLHDLLPWTAVSVDPSTAVLTLIVVSGFALASLLVAGTRRAIRAPVTRATRSVPMGTWSARATGTWLLLSAWRDGRVRLQVGLVVLTGVLVAAGIVGLGSRAEVLVPAAIVGVLLMSSAPALLISHAASTGAWLLTTGPPTSRFVAILIFGGLTCAAGIAALAAVLPLAVMHPDLIGFTAVVILTLAPVVAAVGCLLPWDPRAMVRQFTAGLAVLMGFGVAFQAVIWLQATGARLVPGMEALGLAGLVVGVAGVWGACIASILPSQDRAHVRR
jgi:hypothetical protein